MIRSFLLVRPVIGSVRDEDDDTDDETDDDTDDTGASDEEILEIDAGDDEP